MHGTSVLRFLLSKTKRRGSAMHAEGIVARVLDPCLGGLHAKRAAALRGAVSAVVRGAALSLSCIAVKLGALTAVRHRVKSVDRLLGNAALHKARPDLYGAVAQRWLAGLPQVLLVVDWSDLSHDQRWQWLRASVAVEGRSVTLYEEVHPQKRLGNRKVHRKFLKRVAQLLPPGCVPIVMTDAGFHSTWFQLVQERGWSYVGRIRGRDNVRQAGGAWRPCTSLYGRATAQAQDLGRWDYVLTNCTPCRLVLIKKLPQGRHSFNMYGKRRKGRTSAKCAKGAKEPWLLAASFSLDHLDAQSIVKLYAQRMQIEESFRDTKNLRWGQGLQVTRSDSQARLEMLLLIGHLAAFVQRLTGEQAKAQQLELQFSPNNRTSRAQISVMTLARRIIDTSPPLFAELMPWAAIARLRQQAQAAWASA
jgi:hypothetical protein